VGALADPLRRWPLSETNVTMTPAPSSFPMSFAVMAALCTFFMSTEAAAQADDVYWVSTPLDDDTCAEKGKAPGCVRVCRIEGDQRLCHVADEAPAQIAGLVPNTLLCGLGQCLPAEVREKATGGFVIAFENTLGESNCSAPGADKTPLQFESLDAAASSTAVPGLINPYVYEWIFGNDCCQDCWAVHRSLGLPCIADYACCAGHCGMEPGCGTGVDGPDGPDGPKDGEPCGEPYSVNDATVVNDLGQECLYTGEVIPTMVGNVCQDVVGDGFVHDCEELGSVGGGVCLETLSPGELPGM